MDPDGVIEAWGCRTGEFSPRYYAHYGPNRASEALRGVLDATVGPDAAVLELGCSAGRHLAHLAAHGYRDLHGVDVNDRAFEVMAGSYPDLAATGTFYADAIETVAPEFDDGRFDAVYSVETLQHIHPDNAWVFAEVARIAAEVLVVVEIEAPTTPDPAGDPAVNYVDDGLPLYYRHWGEVFSSLGFAEVDSEPIGNDTLRAFRPVDP